MSGPSDLLDAIESGELGDPLPLVAYIAGQHVALPAGELAAARRRALLVRAAGGDPTRALEIDDPAAKALAVDLHTDERQRALAAGLDGLAPVTRDRPSLRAAVVFLAGDLDLAWRLFAVALLAEELAT